jgi:hypothetical protein
MEKFEQRESKRVQDGQNMEKFEQKRIEDGYKTGRTWKRMRKGN